MTDQLATFDAATQRLIDEAIEDAHDRHQQLTRELGANFDPFKLNEDDRAHVVVLMQHARLLQAEQDLEGALTMVEQLRKSYEATADALASAHAHLLGVADRLPFFMWRTRRRLRAFAARIEARAKPSDAAIDRLLAAVAGADGAQPASMVTRFVRHLERRLGAQAERYVNAANDVDRKPWPDEAAKRTTHTHLLAVGNALAVVRDELETTRRALEADAKPRDPNPEAP